MNWTKNLPYFCQVRSNPDRFTVIYSIQNKTEAYDFHSDDYEDYEGEGYYNINNLFPVAPLSDILKHYPETLI